MADSFYSLGVEFGALESLLDEAEAAGLLDDGALVAVSEWMSGLDMALEQKVERCVQWIRQQEALADGAHLESIRLRALRDARQARAARVKKAIQDAMDSIGRTRIETPTSSVSIQANGGKQAVEVLVPVEQLPDDCVRITREPDRESLRARIEAGDTTMAVLLPRKSSLRIK